MATEVKEDKKTPAAAPEEKQSTALATAASPGLPMSYDDMEQDAGQGFSQDSNDRIMPFIVLLQSGSPEVKRANPEFIPGAQEGMLLNKATKQLYAGEEEVAKSANLPMLVFQQCGYDHAVVQWIPRDNGGGFVARHELVGGSVEMTMQKIGGRQVTDPKDPNKKIWRTDQGHDLIDTRYHYGNIVHDDGRTEPAVIGFSSTGHTSSREWTTMLDNNRAISKKTNMPFKLPSWSKKFVVGSRPKKNTKGDFFVINVRDAGPVDAQLYAIGKDLANAIAAGQVRAGEESQGGDDAGGRGDGSAI